MSYQVLILTGTDLILTQGDVAYQNSTWTVIRMFKRVEAFLIFSYLQLKYLKHEYIAQMILQTHVFLD